MIDVKFSFKLGVFQSASFEMLASKHISLTALWIGHRRIWRLHFMSFEEIIIFYSQGLFFRQMLSGSF